MAPQQHAPVRTARATLLLALAVVACAGTGPGRRVDVGGHRLRAHVAGEGEPAVVLDAGLGDTLESWDLVWPRVAAFTRVVVYDRAGLGRSEPGPTPRTAARLGGELRRLLRSRGVPPPWVLVGHSFGALNVRWIAARHPEEVAGLVLVDPTPTDFPGRERELLAPEQIRRRRTAMGLAPPAARDELDAVERSVAQVRALGAPAVPTVVLSSSRPEEAEAFRREWAELQRRLAERLRAEHVVVADAGHYIQSEAPLQVVEAIRRMVEATRSPPPAAGPARGPG